LFIIFNEKSDARKEMAKTESTVSTRVRWNEENLVENENSRTATMTIDEPPTPFNFEYCEDEDEGKCSCSVMFPKTI
jgi:hypothetical protein